MKKVVTMCLAAMMALAMLIGCGNAAPTEPDVKPTGKVVVNIEGTVTAVNGGEITLEGGKVVVISEDTVFAGDPDTNNQVSDQINVGNFIQGYTSDDLSLDKVNAAKIYANRAPQRTGGKIVIDFEGTISAVDGDRITLDNGKVVLVDANTVYTDVNGTAENPALAVGAYIQGNTDDDPAAAEVTAKRIHIVVS